jgi:thiosulfate/3-mercaptopyruvate sulfurtransferase
LDNSGNLYDAVLLPQYVRSVQQLVSIVDGSTSSQLVDARGAPRFNGEVAEPRPGLASGHIPRSINVPYKAVLEPNDTLSFRSPEEIAAAYTAAGVDLSHALPIVTTCGSGVSAAVLSFAMHLATGREPSDFPVYDGSWSEWGSIDSLPKEVA